jgi:hypothetical protein
MVNINVRSVEIKRKLGYLKEKRKEMERYVQKKGKTPLSFHTRGWTRVVGLSQKRKPRNAFGFFFCSSEDTT